MDYKIFKIDPYLKPFKSDIELRMNNLISKKKELLKENQSLCSFASGHLYFGVHRLENAWVYREWAPGADEMFLTGDFNNWQLFSNPMKRLENGVFEIVLEGNDALKVGQKIQAIVKSGEQILRRVPSYATRVVQDSETYLWCAEVDDVLWDNFEWSDERFKMPKTPYIYECHIGMAQEDYKVSSFNEFAEKNLPRIKKLGYNTIQIMAVMEHPYYGSFGYQVSSFYAVSSRFGTGRDLKNLINKAHKMGIAVLLDVVHSHAVKNTGDGLNMFDSTEYQYFHSGEKGNHVAWDTKLFNYGKNEVLHFLLSNLKYWLEVYHFDGFRFDGVTSMLYHDHGLGSAFMSYDMYFSQNTDTDAVTYLQLANELVHLINKNAITIAEDMSGMPGMALPIDVGGIGFDYRLSMGVPDLWIKFIKDFRDENWDMGKLFYELTTRRPKEKNIGYSESHDQALVGDKTIMFRLCDAEMYDKMSKNSNSGIIDRGMALHKMIRLITASLAGEGYLNFMGNEFGHPEWIDFPREANGWSYHYCRRQWSLADNNQLRYGELECFDKAMLSLLKRERILSKKTHCRYLSEQDKIIIYSKGNILFAFNFNPQCSFDGYFVKTDCEGEFKSVLSTDEAEFGGFERIEMGRVYTAQKQQNGEIGFKCYIPLRTAVVFKKI